MSFEQKYRCYSPAFIEKPHLENGDKVILPPSSLSRLVCLRIDYPMTFEIHNPAASKSSHCGVLEFVSEEGMIILPLWMMKNLSLEEGSVVRLKSARLSKANYVKIQPHTMDFLDIRNPKEALENSLRSFSCLTVGDTIVIPYNNKKYSINILEAKPSNAVSVIDTDCEVDFAAPLDYKEPEPEPQPQPVEPVRPRIEERIEPPKFVPFTGSRNRLDGVSVEPILPPVLTAPAAPSKLAKKPAGKVVFGTQKSGQQCSASCEQQKPLEKEKPSCEPSIPKFQSFTGKKYTLS